MIPLRDISGQPHIILHPIINLVLLGFFLFSAICVTKMNSSDSLEGHIFASCNF